MLRGAEAACLESDYQLLLLNITGQAKPERCLHTLIERRIDGLLLLRADGDEPWIDELTDRTDAVIAVDCIHAHRKLDSVMFDTDAAMAMAIEHLAKLGHRRIGYLGRCAAKAVGHNTARRGAFDRAMAAAGLEVDRRWVFDMPVEPVSQSYALAGPRGAEHYLSLGGAGPTAVVTFDDQIAAGALQRLLAAGVRVPGDMSILTVEDTALCRLLTPRLTALRHPLEAMGRLAAERLIGRARHRAGEGEAPDPAERVTMCQPTLTSRDSTAAPRGGAV
jgi:LacI family transcriptional regulator